MIATAIEVVGALAFLVGAVGANYDLQIVGVLIAIYARLLSGWRLERRTP